MVNRRKLLGHYHEGQYLTQHEVTHPDALPRVANPTQSSRLTPKMAPDGYLWTSWNALLARDAASTHPHDHELGVYGGFSRYAAKFVGNVDWQDAIF